MWSFPRSGSPPKIPPRPGRGVHHTRGQASLRARHRHVAARLQGRRLGHMCVSPSDSKSVLFKKTVESAWGQGGRMFSWGAGESKPRGGGGASPHEADEAAARTAGSTASHAIQMSRQLPHHMLLASGMHHPAETPLSRTLHPITALLRRCIPHVQRNSLRPGLFFPPPSLPASPPGSPDYPPSLTTSSDPRESTPPHLRGPIARQAHQGGLSPSSPPTGGTQA